MVSEWLSLTGDVTASWLPGHLHARGAGVVSYALVGSVKGFVIDAIVGAVVQAVTGLPYTVPLISIGWTVMSAANAYWLGSGACASGTPAAARSQRSRSTLPTGSKSSISGADDLDAPW